MSEKILEKIDFQYYIKALKEKTITWEFFAKLMGDLTANDIEKKNQLLFILMEDLRFSIEASEKENNNLNVDETEDDVEKEAEIEDEDEKEAEIEDEEVDDENEDEDEYKDEKDDDEILQQELSLESITGNPGLLSVSEHIFSFLDFETLMNCRKVSKSFNQVLNKPKLWLRQLKLEQLEDEDFYRIWNELAQKLDGSGAVEKDFVMILIKMANTTSLKYPLKVAYEMIKYSHRWSSQFIFGICLSGGLDLELTIVMAKFLLEHEDPNRTISSVYGLEGIHDRVSALHLASNWG